MKIQRNEPCPCGSGVKYKKCCFFKIPVATEVPAGITPVELVHRRRAAFDSRDFGFVYDTYHCESMFREQFPSRDAYLSHAKSTLSTDFRILDCQTLKDRLVEDGSAEVLFYLRFSYLGKVEETFELSSFQKEAGQWRYHSSQKLSKDEFSGAVEDIDWEDFEKVQDKIYF